MFYVLDQMLPFYKPKHVEIIVYRYMPVKYVEINSCLYQWECTASIVFSEVLTDLKSKTKLCLFLNGLFGNRRLLHVGKKGPILCPRVKPISVLFMSLRRNELL